MFYNESINGRHRTLNLCSDCTTAMQQAGELEDLSAPFSCFVSPFLQHEESPDPLTSALSLVQKPSAVEEPCPVCHQSADHLIRTGMLGCAACYEWFRAFSETAMEQLHGTLAYHGQVPRSHREIEEKQKQAQALRCQLQEAIAAEQYESAAILRDRIRALEVVPAAPALLKP